MAATWYRFVHGPYQDVIIGSDGKVLDDVAHGHLRAKAACYAWNGPPQPGLSGEVVHKNGDTNDCSFQNVSWKGFDSDNYDKYIRHINGNLTDNRIDNLYRNVNTHHPARCWVRDYTPGVKYKYEKFQDMIVDIVELSERPNAPIFKGPILWNNRQDVKMDDQYTTCVVLPHVGRYEWTPKWVHAFNILFKQEFGLQEDIKIVGLVKAKKNIAKDATEAFYDQACWHFVFVVHEKDSQQLCNWHRSEVGFRWLFDVLASSGMDKRLPKAFVQTYDV
jgi:hypothetical protein